MTAGLKPHLAAAAQRELEAREKHYPTMVEGGQLTRDAAEADLAAWRAIAELFRAGDVETELTWAQLEAAAAAALHRREEALAAKPGDQPLFERLTWVEAIHSRIACLRSLLASQESSR